MRISRLALTILVAACLGNSSGPIAGRGACDADNGGLKLPDGYCASVFAKVDGARHVAVASDGTVYLGTTGRGGTAVALRDTNGDGKADERSNFGPGPGTGIAVSNDAVYFAMNDRIIRYQRKQGDLVPSGDGVVIVEDMPTGGHTAKTMALGPDDALYVDHGSRTNSCQVADRRKDSPGHQPCTELETRAGIWRYSATTPGQTPADGVHWATGLRNAMAIAVDPTTGKLWGAIHGRDQLGGLWGYTDQQNAELPAEEFGPIAQGADYGWPYCYYDGLKNRKVLAPEYGGNGTTQGQCASKTQPAIAFPAHWAPMQLVFENSDGLGAKYRGGAFLAFHGSWNRAPLPQAGFRVVFIPFSAGQPTGKWDTFAIGAESTTFLRASGVAVGPDGSLYIASDGRGTVWRVTRKG